MEITREAVQFLGARNHILSILEARGFDVSTLIAESPEEVAELFRDASKIHLSYYVPHTDNPDRKCKVLFGTSLVKLLVEVQKVHIADDHPEKVVAGRDEVLLIVFGKLGITDIKKTIIRSRALGIQIDAIHVLNLQFNPLKHELVPEYEPVEVGGEEEEQILSSVGTKKLRSFPLIRSHDIISRILGLRPKVPLFVLQRLGCA
jgi:DNA-directed RNA polymerase subunit H (RpoH/RPB5)